MYPRYIMKLHQSSLHFQELHQSSLHFQVIDVNPTKKIINKWLNKTKKKKNKIQGVL